MAQFTLRVLDGSDRGRTFDSLLPPVTIGREEGNSIQLNDERVSRYHVKIQCDNERLVLTDLESTNGTKVNGEHINLRILKLGDLIYVGKSVLIFGSRDEIAGHLADLRDSVAEGDPTFRQRSLVGEASSIDFELNIDDDAELQVARHELEPPELPDRLTPAQAAQLGELLEFFHHRLRAVLASVKTKGRDERISVSRDEWQFLVDIQSRISEYLRKIGDPDA